MPCRATSIPTKIATLLSSPRHHLHRISSAAAPASGKRMAEDKRESFRCHLLTFVVGQDSERTFSLDYRQCVILSYLSSV